MGLIDSEIDMLQIEKRIRGRVKQQMEKSQREYYLNEQMKAIQKELGDMEDAPNEIADLENKIAESGMSAEANEKATSELNKLKMMSPMSAEAAVVRNYIDWLVKVPWKKAVQDLAQPREGRERFSRKITTGWRRSRSESSSTWPCSSGSRSSRDRFCVSSDLRVSVRPRWVRVLPGRRTANSCVCPWVECAMKPRFGVTAAPISARCRARLCRTSARSEFVIRCSCSMRSTRCRWTFAVTLRRLCSRFSIRNRIHDVRRSLSRSGFRRVRRHVRLHGQYIEHSRAVAGSHGGDQDSRLYRGREAEHCAQLSDREAAGRRTA